MSSTEDRLRQYLKRVTIDLGEAQERLRMMESRQAEPVAVIGMACRFPGAVASPEDLWDVVASGRDVIGEFPADRGWDLEALYHPDPEHPGTCYTRAGGFLDGADEFDAAFFGISPREAAAMEPQQRHLLETAWEALERAGIDPSSLNGTPTGVFVGAGLPGFGTPHTDEEAEGYLLTGNALSVLSGRIAYALGLEGAAVTVDTACSSSLVAIHLASQSLRQGESSLALAGGVTVMATPGGFTEFSRQRGLAPDGRCKSFAAAADGTAFSEGAGLLVLERLSDARRNGHQVWAVVRGSAVNQDGASNGLTAPNGPSQQRVIRAALAGAGLSASEVDAVEAHGTGTTLGDPIEADVLLATYGQGRPEDRPLWLGSVKSNIGHTQGAAGVAGVIKMVMALRNGLLPATLHVDAPSPHVDWSAGDVRLLTEPRNWPETGRPRRAGVSAFGMSGTNAHLILEQAPAPAPGPAPVAMPVVSWTLSARSPAALRAQARRLADRVAVQPGPNPADTGWSLLKTRAVLDHRAVAVGEDLQPMVEALRALADGQPHPGLVAPGVSAITGHPGPVLIFPGQGAQWIGMGAELLGASPVFAARAAECERALAPYVDWSLTEVLRGGGDALARVDVVQPVLWAVMVSLAAVWAEYGVRPAAVVGHSQGEIAAACVAGALTLDDAAKTVALRSRALRRLSGHGAMASIGADEHRTAQLVGESSDVAVAALNGPSATVVTGLPGPVAATVAAAQEQGLRARMIEVDYASHGPQVDQISDEVAQALAGIAAVGAEVVFYSAVTGRREDGAGLDAGYWMANLRQPVRFSAAVHALLADGYRVFIEASPHPMLIQGVEECADQAGVRVAALPTLRRDHGDLAQVARAVAQAFTAGVDVDWSRWYPLEPGPRVVDLPTYAFQRQRFPLSGGRRAADPVALGLTASDHPVLVAAVQPAGTDRRLLTGRISRQVFPWLADHEVAGHPLVPGAALVEWALRAADESGCAAVEELVLHAPTMLPLSGGLSVQVTVGEPDDDGRRDVDVYCRDGDGDWLRQASGTLGQAVVGQAEVEPESQWPPPGAEPISREALYERAAEAGYRYGPAFQGVHALWRRGHDLFAEVRLPEAAGRTRGFGVHPALLDAALHPLLLLAGPADRGPALPFSWNDVSLRAGAATSVRVTLSSLKNNRAFRLSGTDPAGAPVFDVGRVTVRPADTRDMAAVSGSARGLFALEWTAGQPARPGPGRDWLDLDAATASLNAGTAAPSIVVARVATAGTGRVDPARGLEAAGQALALLQRWLADDRLADARLVVLTEGAVAVADPDPAGAAVWGLVRSAQVEHPGRFLLIDSEPGTSVEAAVGLCDPAEPQLAIRQGAPLVPRLRRIKPTAETGSSVDLDPAGTVLIVGGTGVLGGAVAEHLVRSRRAGRLLLASRQGTDAPAAAELVPRLTALGADVEVAALDVTDPAAVSDLIGGISPAHPLTAVIHAAGQLDDGVITSLTPAKLARTWAAKAAGAANLHAATAHLPVRMFVVFSSAAALLGSPGQSGYAAANAFCDALAACRRAAGPPALSLAWGLWADSSGMTAALDGTDLSRMRRGGITPLSRDRALTLFEAAVRSDRPYALAAALDPRPISGDVPAVLRGLAGPGRPVAAADAAPADHLVRLAPDRRRDVLTELVRTRVAAVLGHASPDGIGAEATFKELGLDSLTAVELRNHLAGATGLRLPATLVFDHPTPQALGAHLASRFERRGGAATPARTTARPDEPVAIISMACRYPGGVASPEDLWRLVSAAEDAIGAFPADRGWDLGGLYHPDPDHPRTTYVRHGGFLEEPMDFDAGFFGVSPREALATDPQQRLLLEVAWELLERARIVPATLKGTPTGVYTGVMYHDYGGGAANRDARLEGYGWLAGSGSMLSGRTAFTFGFEGPAVTVDTACSSSLVAIHLAGQALRQGECDLALAGGVTVMATPDAFVDFARQRGLAGDGRCKAFAATADGTSLSEGAGLVLLERLSDARRHGHEVLAVIRGSAVNQDGASNGLTAPNGVAQERVIRAALATAGIRAADVDVVEAHGTGTTLGDPIEAGALLAAYGEDRPTDRPLWLGSIKSNLGHTQAAAGVAGVIKMVTAMRNGILPPTLHADEPSPHVDWSSGALRLLTRPEPWTGAGRPRRAGISSFGASGTNAHLIVEAAAAEPIVPVGEPVGEPVGAVPWVVSARTEPALRAQLRRLREFAAADATLSPLDVGWSLCTTRQSFERRVAVMGRSREELLTELEAAVPAAPVADGQVWLFSGQGSQRMGMGTGLYERFPVFAAAFDEVCGLLDPYLEQGLAAVVRAGPIDHTTFAQSGLFAFQVALARLLAAMGLAPRAVVGHSVGEIAAAHVAGVLDLPDACRLVAARATLMGRLPAGGAMVAIQADPAELADTLPETVSIAALNTPGSTVVSGPEDLVARVAEHWAAHGRKTRRLVVSHAFHSVLMEPMLADFAAAIDGLTFRAPAIPFVSTLTGQTADALITTPGYWVRQVREPVRFHAAVRHAAAGRTSGRADVFLEIGPAPMLATAARHILDDVPTVAALDPGQPDDLAFGKALALLHGAGISVDWTAWFPADPAPRSVDLPTYAFQHRRFWLDGNASHGVDTVVERADGGHLLSGAITAASGGWPAEHVIGGVTLLPGTALLGWALRAADETGSTRVEELNLEAPLLLPPSGALPVQVVVSPPDDALRRELHIYSRQDDEWLRHASGTLTAEPVPSSAPAGGQWPPADAVPLDVSGLYADAAAAGYAYGPSFQGLRAAWRHGDDLLAEVVLPETAGEAPGHQLHPALLDAALHPLLVDQRQSGELWLPFSWNGVTLHAVDATAVRVRLSGNGARVRLTIADTGGAPVLTADSVHLRRADPERFRGAVPGLFVVEWVPVSDPVGVGVDDVVVVEVGVVGEALGVVRGWLGGSDGRGLVLVTRGAVGGVPDPDGAAVWGLVRCAQLEHPGRFWLVDLEVGVDVGVVAGCVVEPQVVVRGGRVLVPRLVRGGGCGELVGGVGERAWRLGVGGGGSLEDVLVVGCPEVLGPLGSGEVRIDVRAAGVNFRDVLVGLGVVSGVGGIGGEGAGVVVEVGSGVSGLVVGDRVMGLFGGAFGPVVVADARSVVVVPEGWGFREAAGVVVAFLTAWYGLVELAGVRAGESVLVHAATGGVGRAAVQVARLLGATVFATASPGKQGLLVEMGFDEAHRASSRDVGFAAKFGSVDVVLNCLAGELTDASLGLLGDGGRFVELGKTDIRVDPGVWYRAFDLMGDVAPERVASMLGLLRELFVAGRLRALPVQAWPLGRVREVLRLMSQARHVGKVVLDVPAVFDPEGTVLITGGTGVLGGLVAGHVVEVWGARHVVLVSRRGLGAPGAVELVGRLGGRVRVVAADVGDVGAVRAVVAGVDPGHPLTGVVHAAGVVDDGLVAGLTAERLAAVWRPKVDGVVALHAATVGQRLSFFTVFSSAAATSGSPGQANYAAANAYCDALMVRRRAAGLPGQSIGWGLWQSVSGITGGLSDTDRHRMRTSGMTPLSDEQGLALFDAAISHGAAHLVAADLDLAALAVTPAEAVPELLRELATGNVRRPATATAQTRPGDLAAQLAGMDAAERQSALLDVVRTQAATVLGHADLDAVRPETNFKDMGFDSLTAVELRNRLSAVTGLRLPAAMVFDYPDPVALAGHLDSRLSPEIPATPAAVAFDSVLEELAKLEGMLTALPGHGLDPRAVEARLEALLGSWKAAHRHQDGGNVAERLETANADQVLEFIDSELGVARPE
nr:type I polyketide synthase [Dactylosporangium roseum]